MSALTYREPTSGLTLSVEFYGAYEGSWAGTRPRYRYTATWSKESGNVDLQGTDLYGPAEGRQSWHGDCNNLYRELHAFANFLTSDAEKYAYADNGGSDGYTFDAAVAERAYGVDGELSELACFLSDRERFGKLLRDAPIPEADFAHAAMTTYRATLSEEDGKVWDAFTGDNKYLDAFAPRFAWSR